MQEEGKQKKQTVSLVTFALLERLPSFQVSVKHLGRRSGGSQLAVSVLPNSETEELGSTVTD